MKFPNKSPTNNSPYTVSSLRRSEEADKERSKGLPPHPAPAK
jgi:hypothetical protein